MKVQKGDWVQIYDVVLKPEERADNVPEDTAQVPLEMRVNGFIQVDAVVGDIVDIVTLSGRIVKGKLTKAFPCYELSYGKHVPEVAKISLNLRKNLCGRNSI